MNRPACSRGGLSLFALLAAACVAAPAAAQTGPIAIRWRSSAGASEASAAAEANTPDAMAALTGGEPRHVVVQLDHPPTPTDRTNLAAMGIRLGSYLGGNAFFAKVVGGDDLAPAAQAVGVAISAEIDPARKLHPRLLRGDVPAYARCQAPAVAGKLSVSSQQADEQVESVALYVIFHPDVALADEGQAAVERHGGVVRSVLRSINGLVIWLPLANLDALAREDVVQWAEPPLPPLDGTNDSSRELIQADVVQDAPYNLDGSGITVMVYDAGAARESHDDFDGRLTVRDETDVENHPTHVAGTIGGSGELSDGLYRGVAPGVTMESYGFEVEGELDPGFLYTDPGDLEADYDEAINTYGAVIANNSIGSNVASNRFDCDWEGDYGATSMLIDAIVRGSLGSPIRIIWANGNERGGIRCGTHYHTTAPPACAKNHITVGAVNSNNDSMTEFSSWGPTDDGRLKPDVCAPGCQSNGDYGVTSTSSGGQYSLLCGTSMACPAVTGLCALLMQDYAVQYPGQPLPRNATLKVFLAHNAVDIGQTGPDYMSGYGSVRAQNTVDFVRSGDFAESAVDQGEHEDYLMVVPPGTPVLKATLAWDDPPGAVNTVPELVNDLDVVAISPSDETHYPWTLDPNAPNAPAVRTQPDRLNNIEQVLVDSPEAGTWIIRVTGYSVPSGPQEFSIAGTPDMQTCSPVGRILLDAQYYPCTATAAVTVIDCDLDLDPNVVETITVNVRSTTEPVGEAVLLTATAANSAEFAGTLDLSETDAAGVLQISDGDTVTAVYADEDDGTGNPAVAEDVATVDCLGPAISDVDANPIAVSAEVTFETDEPACGTVRYGLSCGALTESEEGDCDQTSHSIDIPDLLSNTTYFYVVDAVDDAGNASTDDNDGACYTFTTRDHADDYFTELFGTDNDLTYLSVTLTPSMGNDFYTACAEPIISLPTDPEGGTELSLTADDFAQVSLSGETVLLYERSYDGFYVGSNGYVTFTAGDAEDTESFDAHFDAARVSALFDDLNPTAGGTVSWRQLGDRAAVTWQTVPESGKSTENTFQIEMFFDGRIRLSWTDVAARDGLVGLSSGDGVPVNFAESDVSAFHTCNPTPPTVLPVWETADANIPLEITLPASDEGLPDPPGALDIVVTSLPTHGSLVDPNAGSIDAVPYTLVDYGNVVVYTSEPMYSGPDAFTFKANDGGTEPEGGDSNDATVSIEVVDCWPAVPNDPSPSDGAVDVPAAGTTLSWTGDGGDVGTSIGQPADVLFVTTGGDPSILRTELAGLPEIDAADYFNGDAATPTLTELQEYDTVVVMSNWSWADADAVGDALADYVDAGGKVIQVYATFTTDESLELTGRFVTEGTYEPFVHGSPLFVWFPLHLGDYDPNHPIMAGITTVSDRILAGVDVKPGAAWVASWDNGTPLVATRGTNVVGINLAPFSAGVTAGDYVELFRNAVVWLLDSATAYDVLLDSENPPTTTVCTDLEASECETGPLTMGLTYYWQVVARNGCGERAGPVWSFRIEGDPLCTLTLELEDADGSTVTVEPNNPDAPPYHYPCGTQLTLTAEPEDGTLLRHWRIYDPNYPGDGNYVQTDTNNPLVVMLDTDWEIHASFQCAPNVHQSLPLSAIAIGLCGLVARRMRRRR